MTFPYELSLAQVVATKPCDGAMERLAGVLPKRGKISAAKARDLGCTYDDVIWIASAIAMDDESLAKRLTGYLNDNAKRVLHIFEEAAPDDSRVRDCIMATDKWLVGLNTEEEWQAAAWAAWAARAARDARAAWAAWAARAAWAAWAARDAWAAWDAWAARAARAARDAEFHAWQFDRLIYWLCEAEPVCLAMPERVA